MFVLRLRRRCCIVLLDVCCVWTCEELMDEVLG